MIKIIKYANHMHTYFVVCSVYICVTVALTNMRKTENFFNKIKEITFKNVCLQEVPQFIYWNSNDWALKL